MPRDPNHQLTHPHHPNPTQPTNHNSNRIPTNQPNLHPQPTTPTQTIDTLAPAVRCRPVRQGREHQLPRRQRLWAQRQRSLRDMVPECAQGLVGHRAPVTPPRLSGT